jgi:L-asparagine oxygenase
MLDEVWADSAGQARLRVLARQLDPGDERDAESSRSVWAERGAVMATALPAAAMSALHRYRGRGSDDEGLLLRGLLGEVPDLGPTPSTLTPAQVGAGARRAALVLLAVASQLGEAVGFASLYEGRIVQHVAPVRSHEAEQTSGDSTPLLWHVEDAFSADRCHYLALLCLRGDPSAVTTFASARAVADAVGERWAKVLRLPRFAVWPDTAHTGPAPAAPLPVRVLSGPAEDPEICFDAVYLRPADPDDDEAAQALRLAGEAMDAVAVRRVLAPGDLLVLDNRRVVHGRTRYPARYDGGDRWLLRALVCASLPDHRRRRGLRALTA